MNWISVARCQMNLGVKLAGQAAAAATHSPPFSLKNPRQCLTYLNGRWIKFFATPKCPDAGANFRITVNVLSSYDKKLENVQVMLSGWFKNIIPIGDKLTWSIVRDNVLMQGEKAVEYLRRQHEPY